MIFTSTRINARELAERTGWKAEPEGLCRDDVCVSFQSTPDAELDLHAVANALQRPLVADEANALWSLGPETGQVLLTAQAPEIVLPDWKGNEFHLSSLRGRKVCMVAWSSY